MKQNWYNALLQISAFLVPVYFVYYAPLHDNPNHPFIKRLWKLTIAGFCFYGMLILMILAIKNGSL